MALGGKREGAGRKKGVPNKKTQELRDRVAAAGIMPLDYMLSVLRNEKMTPESRMDAAKAAAPYLHAKLQSMEVKGDPDKPLVTEITFKVVDPGTAGD